MISCCVHAACWCFFLLDGLELQSLWFVGCFVYFSVSVVFIASPLGWGFDSSLFFFPFLCSVLGILIGCLLLLAFIKGLYWFVYLMYAVVIAVSGLFAFLGEV